MQQQVSYSRVFEKRGYRSPKRKCAWEASEFLAVLPIATFLKNVAIGHHFKIYTHGPKNAAIGAL